MNVLEIEYVATDDLIPYINNSRTHSESQIKQIATSISEFGFTNPILIDEEQTIIAGHGRVMAAEVLSMDTVPCVRLIGLTEAQRKAYVIADNKLALNAGWDFEAIKTELELLKDLDFDIDLLGFDVTELDEILNGWSTDIELPSDNDDPVPVKITITCEELDKDDLLGVIQRAVDESGIERVKINA